MYSYSVNEALRDIMYWEGGVMGCNVLGMGHFVQFWSVIMLKCLH